MPDWGHPGVGRRADVGALPGPSRKVERTDRCSTIIWSVQFDFGWGCTIADSAATPT